MADENVTIRRHKTLLNESLDLSFESTSSEVIRRHSLPDLSTKFDSDKDDLQKELLQLRNELESAHLEILRLSEENSSLKDALIKHKLKTQPSSEPSAKVLTSRNLNLTIDDNMSLIDLEQNTSTSYPTIDGATSLSTYTLRENGNCGISSYVQPKVVKNVQQPEVPTHYPFNPGQICNVNRPSQKLCIISSNKVNNILTLALNTFPCYDVCHYISTNCGTKQLLDNVNKKLINFNKQDYCLIFIGEHDFKTTVNYYDLVISIRETLMSITNTNLVLCLPTYEFNGYNNIFNSRVETFNTLLYQDICKYNYAILFDSNLNLKYDSTMFYKRSGVLNRHGLKNIFNTLKYYIFQDPQRLSTMVLPSKLKPRKGTIPFYFSAVTKNNYSSNNSYVLSNKEKDQFFRKESQ